MNFPKTSFLETERLILRELTPAVYLHLFTKCSDDEIASFLNLKSNEELNSEKEKFQKGLTTYRITFCNFQLIDKLTNEIIGACGFHTWYLQHARAEIGYALYEASKKQNGYMTEALKAILQYGFNVLKFNRVEAFVSLDNIASVKLLEGNGFVYEGLLRAHYFNKNVAEDSAVFGLLQSDFKKADK